MPHEAKSELQKTVDEITGYKVRTRRILIVLAAAVLLDIALTVAVIALGSGVRSQTRQNRQLITEIHASQVNACQLGNKTGTAQAFLWETALTLAFSKAPANVRAQEKLIIPYVQRTFTPVDCTRLYHGG